MEESKILKTINDNVKTNYKDLLINAYNKNIDNMKLLN